MGLKWPTMEAKAQQIATMMDKDGNGTVSLGEVVRFFSILQGAPQTEQDVMDTPDFREFVGRTPDEVAKRISTMCDEEEKLDAVLAGMEGASAEVQAMADAAGAASEENAGGDRQEKIVKIVGLMDTDGDGNITEAEVVAFFSFLEGRECTAEDVQNTPDLHNFVGKSSEDVIALIAKMCEDEEKLDFILAKFAARRA